MNSEDKKLPLAKDIQSDGEELPKPSLEDVLDIIKAGGNDFHVMTVRQALEMSGIDPDKQFSREGKAGITTEQWALIYRLRDAIRIGCTIKVEREIIRDRISHSITALLQGADYKPNASLDHWLRILKALNNDQEFVIAPSTGMRVNIPYK